MARLAAREVLVLSTKDDCSSRTNSKNREGIDGAIRAYITERPDLARKASKTSELLWDKPPGLCNTYTRRNTSVSEDELQEEGHLG